MSATFILVLIIMVVLIAFILFLVRSLSVSAGIKIRNDMIKLLESYDTIMEDKTREITRLEKELEKLNKKKILLKPKDEVFQAQVNVGTGSGSDRVTIPTAATYRNAAFGAGYGAIREHFRVTARDEQTILRQVISETGNDNKLRGKIAEELKKKLSFDTVFAMSMMSSGEQLGILSESLEGDDRELLADYCESHGTDDFQISGFCDWLDSLIKLERDVFVIRGSENSRNDSDRICEGIQIVAGNKIYDYSINESELN